MSSPLRKPDGIHWNAAAVELPPIPTVPAGQDAMSATISAVLPTLAAELTANVAALSAKENTFSGKVGAAQVAYQNSDDAGSQSVGQVVGMLGQLGQQAGQMGQMAGAPAQAAGGGAGMFGSLIQQAMQGAQSAGGQQGAGQQPGAGAPAAGAGAPAGAAPGSAAAPGQRDDAQPPATPREADRDTADERPPLQRGDDTPWSGAAGPERGESGPGAAPVSPPVERGDDEATRSL